MICATFDCSLYGLLRKNSLFAQKCMFVNLIFNVSLQP